MMASSYSAKLGTMIVVSFGEEIFSGSGRRERAIMDVMDGDCKQCLRMADPIRPVAPVMRTFTGNKSGDIILHDIEMLLTVAYCRWCLMLDFNLKD